MAMTGSEMRAQLDLCRELSARFTKNRRQTVEPA